MSNHRPQFPRSISATPAVIDSRRVQEGRWNCNSVAILKPDPPQTPNVPLFPYLLSCQDHSQSNSAGGKEVFEGNWNTPKLLIRPPNGRIVAVEDFAVFIVIRWNWPVGGLAFRDQVHKKKRLLSPKMSVALCCLAALSLSLLFFSWRVLTFLTVFSLIP